MKKNSIINKIEAFQKTSIESQNEKIIPKLKSINTALSDNLSKSLRSKKEVRDFVKELKQLKK